MCEDYQHRMHTCETVSPRTREKSMAITNNKYIALFCGGGRTGMPIGSLVPDSLVGAYLLDRVSKAESH